RSPAGAGTDGSSRCPQTCTTTVRTVSDGTRLREEFLLDPSVTFLNHGSFGATPRAVFERYQEWQLELERQPVLFFARRLDALLAEARGALGAYVGAAPDDLVLVPNASAASTSRHGRSACVPATRSRRLISSTALSISPGTTSRNSVRRTCELRFDCR